MIVARKGDGMDQGVVRVESIQVNWAERVVMVSGSRIRPNGYRTTLVESFPLDGTQVLGVGVTDILERFVPFISQEPHEIKIVPAEGDTQPAP